MTDENREWLKETLQNKGPYLLTVATAFFLYELYLFLNSFQATAGIYQEVSQSIAQYGYSLLSVFWLFSELIGEAGLIICFSGSILFLIFSVILTVKKKIADAFLIDGILLEGIQFLFILPFIAFWLSLPATIQSYETTAAFSLQMLLITPCFILLCTRLKQPHVNNKEIMKIGAFAIVSFVFAIWIKHFFFNLYALPINFSSPLLVVGLLNSTLTILLSTAILLFAFLPLIRGKSSTFHARAVMAGLTVFGAYFIIYLLIALVDSTYMSYLKLTELWAVSFIVIGVSYFLQTEMRNLKMKM